MSFLTVLFYLFIRPIELLLELIFSVSYKITGIPGISVVLLSVILNILILPLYIKADELQLKSAEKEKALKPWMDRIRKTFKGDERFMILNAYYKENDYSPADVFKGSFSLLLQVPFFIAAFHMLSGLKIFQGTSFLFGLIKDLSVPDGCISLGSISINLLPVLMTAINLISGLVYTKDRSTRNRVQVILIALVFLVLLYDSPSGLVLYWTCNNLFSLLKNIVLEVIGFKGKGEKKTVTKGEGASDKGLSIAGLLYLSVLVGLLVPSDILPTAVYHFVNIHAYSNPVSYMIISFLTGLGTFVLYGSFIYVLSGEKIRKYFSFAVAFVCGMLTMNYFAFGKVGPLTPLMRLQTIVYEPETSFVIFNILIIVLVFMLFFIIWRNNRHIITAVIVAGLLAISFMCIKNLSQITKEYEHLRYATEETQAAELKLSRNGKNVVVIMMDRAMGYLFPYMLNERPELAESFEGFTYYPNTISFGEYTNTGSMALYGGYEYTPDKINSRDDVSLEEKQNESLKVMPVNFYENGYKVTVCDPTYAGYEWIPDLSIYSDYPDMDLYVTDANLNPYMEDIIAEETVVRNRDFFCYSLFRVSPVFIRSFLYDNGMYHAPDRELSSDFVQVTEDPYTARGYDIDFLNGYTALQAFPDITTIGYEDENTFIMISNNTAHNEALLSEPDYVPELSIDNTEYDLNNMDRFTLDGFTLGVDEIRDYKIYQCNMASYLLLADWFDYLRENDLYDNTRIIIVADHGTSLNDELADQYDGANPQSFNPVLLVKDFDSEGEIITDDTFMTNADTPMLAFEGLIDDPVNVSTGNPVTDEDKYDMPLLITDNPNLLIDDNNGNVFTPGYWYEFNGDQLFDPDCWVYYGIE